MARVIGIRYGISSSESYNAGDARVDASHTATYVVEMDNEDQTQPSVLATPGVPAIGQPSLIIEGGYCVSRECTEIAPLIWEVACEFSNAIGGSEEPDDTPPWDRTPKWEWGFETVEEPLLYDAQDDTKAIRNSAGEPLPPVTVPVALPVLTIQRTELTFSGQRILDYVNHVNSAEFWGAAAGQALMSGIDASQTTIQGVKAWEVSYTIKFKMDTHGWDLRLLDQGTYYWSGAVYASERVPFGDDAFQQVLGNLDGSGGRNDTSTPAFVTYKRYDEIDFNDLDLGPWG